MNRSNIHATQIALLLVGIVGILMVADINRITYPARSHIEEFMLRFRGAPTDSADDVIQNLQAKVVSLEHIRDELQEENRALRKQLEAPLPASYAFIPARVLSRTLSSEEKTLLISSGSLEGVEEKMPVVVEDILVGSILSVTPHTARVLLLSDKKSSITIKTDKNTKGIVFGSKDYDTGEVAVLDRVLQSETLLVGDRITSSGEDDMVANLLIGTVEKLLTEPREPFKKAQVALLIDPKSINRVFVIQNK